MEVGQEMQICRTLLENCRQGMNYDNYYGILGEMLCGLNTVFPETFERCFVEELSMEHCRNNVGRLFGHLIATGALPWRVLSHVRLTEEDTTSSSRFFIKDLFHELSDHLGVQPLNERLIRESYDIFPMDSSENTRFCINFLTSVGLGGITDNFS